EAASNARPLLWTQSNFFNSTHYHLYSAVTCAALWDVGAAEQRRGRREALATHQHQFQEWIESGVANLEDSAALVNAELARVEGRDLDAMRSYEQAIGAAKAKGFVHHEALFCEL